MQPVMEFPEDPRSRPEPQSPDGARPGGHSSNGAHSPRAGADHEAEAWLRRELAFLHTVERRIVRRARWRREGWRAAAVALILAMFACCWYLAALSSDGASNGACPSNGATTSSTQKAVSSTAGGTTSGSAHSTAVKSAAATATNCAS